MSSSATSSTVLAALPGGFTIRLEDPTHATVPDVTHLPASLAVKEVKAAGLMPTFTGTVVSSQAPVAGHVVAKGSTVTMHLAPGPQQ